MVVPPFNYIVGNKACKNAVGISLWIEINQYSLFVWLVADGWCWYVLREKYCWLVAGGWFVLRETYCWLVAAKPSKCLWDKCDIWLQLLLIQT
jgi:hypothetical protein